MRSKSPAFCSPEFLTSHSQCLNFRLRAQFYALEEPQLLLGTALTEIIVKKDKVSELKFASGPGRWCSAGGLKMVVVASASLGDPALVVETTEELGNVKQRDLREVYAGSQQISKSDKKGEACEFIIPSQQDSVIDSLKADHAR